MSVPGTVADKCGCIFCREKADTECTEEHVFPKPIGGTFTIKGVCEKCNGYLGHSIDNYLCDHIFVQFERLHRKPGRVANPLAQRETTGRLGNPAGTYVVRTMERKAMPNGCEDIDLTMDAQEKDRMGNILGKIWSRSSARMPENLIHDLQKQKVSNPLLKYTAQIDAHNYKRSLLKIAYELGWYWLGPDFLKDDTAAVLRRCVMDSSIREGEDWSVKYAVRGTAGFIDPQASRYAWWAWDDHPHVALMDSDGRAIWCYIRIFNCIDAVITISEAAASYRFMPRFMAVNAETGGKRESSLSEELTRISRWHSLQVRY